MALGDMVTAYAPGIREIELHAETLMTPAARQLYDAQVVQLTGQGVPEPLAKRLAKMEVMDAACDVIDIARVHGKAIAEAGRIYFALGEMLQLDWLRSSAQALTAENYWQQLAIKSLNLEFYAAQRRLSLSVIARFANHPAPDVAWSEEAAAALVRHAAFIAELRAQPALDYPMLIVALRQIQAITTVQDGSATRAGDTVTDQPRRGMRA